MWILPSAVIVLSSAPRRRVKGSRQRIAKPGRDLLFLLQWLKSLGLDDLPQHHTGRVLETLAEYEPKTLATMHGSIYYSDGAQALRDLAVVMRDVLGPKAQQGETTSIGTIKI